MSSVHPGLPCSGSAIAPSSEGITILPVRVSMNNMFTVLFTEPSASTVVMVWKSVGMMTPCWAGAVTLSVRADDRGGESTRGPSTRA